MLRYLKGTKDFGLKYSHVEDFKLVGHTDSNFDGDKENEVSISRYLDVYFKIPHKSYTNNYLLETTQTICFSKFHYRDRICVYDRGNKGVLSLGKILDDSHKKQVNAPPFLIDNTFTIKLAKNPKFHNQMKHINMKYHMI